MVLTNPMTQTEYLPIYTQCLGIETFENDSSSQQRLVRGSMYVLTIKFEIPHLSPQIYSSDRLF